MRDWYDDDPYDDEPDETEASPDHKLAEIRRLVRTWIEMGALSDSQVRDLVAEIDMLDAMLSGGGLLPLAWRAEHTGRGPFRSIVDLPPL